MTALSGVIVVTGAASGIGWEAARHFTSIGATVLAADINAAGLATLGAGISTITADLARDAGCRAVAQAAARLGRITGLMNCAGLELHGDVIEMPEADWDNRVMDVNLKAIFLLSKHVLPHMIAAGGGAVVNMSSVQALATRPGVARMPRPRAPCCR